MTDFNKLLDSDHLNQTEQETILGNVKASFTQLDQAYRELSRHALLLGDKDGSAAREAMELGLLELNMALNQLETRVEVLVHRVISRNLKLRGIDKCLGGFKHTQSANLH